ncbi:MAG TPA: trehalase-like domain-containing protein [Solirubrobacteraceae bacterium]|nr:trehalase-like domain-containing protein [Solirubrobacteraceae bacterium]
MSTAAQPTPKKQMPQSAAAPSPFPPIADFAFLSNCHTGALVALDGTVDWLCVPRFDSASVFGALLDRQAGGFRFGPFGINVPTARVYEPGTNTLLSTRTTPTGWAIVRDSLTIGPTRGKDLITPHTRPPADEDADHLLVRVAMCLEGEVEMELTCEPVFDYGRTPAKWEVADDGHVADASGASRRSGCRRTWRSGSRANGCVPATSWDRASRSTARSPGPRSWRRPRTSTRPTSDWPPPTTTGAAG